MRIFLFAVVVFISGCTFDKKDDFQNKSIDGNYPQEIAAIIINKCAVSGCHNTQSSINAAKLDLSTWENLFFGGQNGSAVIPFSPQYSHILYYTNTDTALGPVSHPTMPYNAPPLSRAEYLALRDWIANGAPNKSGEIKFSNLNRPKVYVPMQGCNEIGVFDAITKAVMRYIKVGNGAGQAHQVRITPDGKYWAVVFTPTGNTVQFFNTSDDQIAFQVSLPTGAWNTITFTHDSKTAFVCNLAGGDVIPIDLTTRLIKSRTVLRNPHGSHVTKDNFLYVTSQIGNFIYKLKLDSDSLSGDEDRISLNGLQPNEVSSLDPHEILFSPDESRYFITCQRSNEVRVFQTSNDSLLAAIPVGAFPQELALSALHPYLFVTCMNADSVYVINYNSLQTITKVRAGVMPHGIAVDDDHGVVYVANRNERTGGPPPHHTSVCGGARNGYVTGIDLHTFQPLQLISTGGVPFIFASQVLNDPYFVTYQK